MATANGTLYFKGRNGSIVKSYNGQSDVNITASDFSEGMVGIGAIKVNDTNTTHEISVSLDKAAQESGKTIPTASIADIIGFLGGTAVPPS